MNPAYNIALLDNQPSHPMTFLQRLQNFLIFHILSVLLIQIIGTAYQEIMITYNISVENSWMQISSELDFSVEDALPVTPNIVTVVGTDYTTSARLLQR